MVWYIRVVSLEDVIEEIVDISDEFDDDDLIYSKIDDFNYLHVFEGKTTLKKILENCKTRRRVCFLENEKRG